MVISIPVHSTNILLSGFMVWWEIYKLNITHVKQAKQ